MLNVGGTNAQASGLPAPVGLKRPPLCPPLEIGQRRRSDDLTARAGFFSGLPVQRLHQLLGERDVEGTGSHEQSIQALYIALKRCPPTGPDRAEAAPGPSPRRSPAASRTARLPAVGAPHRRHGLRSAACPPPRASHTAGTSRSRPGAAQAR